MIAKLLPVLLAVIGLVAGLGAGLFLRPADSPSEHATATESHDAPAAHEDAEAGHAEDEHAEAAAEKPAESHAADAGHAADEATAEHGDDAPVHDYVKLNNQFVVPVVVEGRVSALVILSLSLEVTAGLTESVYQIEPKLRDSFLQVMFDHANAGGFKGTFTDGSNMVLLRRALLEIAQRIMGSDVSDVLIVDIVRQDS